MSNPIDHHPVHYEDSEEEDLPLIPGAHRRHAPHDDEEAQPKLHLLANTGAPLGLVPAGPIESRCPSLKHGIRALQQRSIHLPTIVYNILGEIWGTFLLVFFIEMVGASAVLSANDIGVWQVAIAQGLGVTIAIYLSAPLSDAHLNPAVTVALAVFRRSSKGFLRLLVYPVAQFVGAFLAAALAYALWAPALDYYEQQHGILRGTVDSQITASAFACYFPNPSWGLPWDTAQRLVTVPTALVCEMVGTAILMFVILVLTDRRNAGIVNPKITPLIIGFTVAVLISCFASHTMAALNPVRDFGPRLLVTIAGWGSVGIPGPRNGFWVYIVGPIVGAIVGAFLHELLFFFPHYVEPAKKRRQEEFERMQSLQPVY